MNMPLVLLNRRRRGGGFSPAVLFASAEPGVWYDPSDLTTLFQNTAGMTPVTAPGQTVALALDKSKGLVLGPELVTSDAAFSLSQATISNLTISANSGAFNTFAETPPFASGKPYRVSFRYSIASGGNLTFRFQNLLRGLTGSGVFTEIFASAPSAFTGLFFRSEGSGWVGTIDNISVRELPGFHATQSILASRPTYAVVPATGRRNLLGFTEEFENAVWVKTNATVTANAAVAPDGTTTADRITSTGADSVGQLISRTANTGFTFSVYLKRGNTDWARMAVWDVLAGSPSGTDQFRVWVNLASGTIGTSNSTGDATYTSSTITPVGDGWFRVALVGSVNKAGIAPVITTASDDASTTRVSGGEILVWGAQLEVGSTATNYQRVGNAFDVTEAGVQSLSYLSFDGIDDFLVTPTITPGVDKAQVFAGVRKLSDAAAAVLAELSVDRGTNAGSFTFFAPPSAAAEYQFRSRGSVDEASPVVASGFAAPITNVLAGLGDIAGDRSTIRVNGTQIAQSTSDQGTGNYLAYPLYIGRRAGTSAPFNGQIYSLAVRFGANLDSTSISNMETWVAGKTGIVI
jgi:hypothetical protein